MWSPFRSRCNGAAEPLRLHMKHGVSDATIYPLRMLASAILRGLKQFFFSYGCVSGFRGHQNPSVESGTEQRARPRRSWRDQQNDASRGTAGAAGRGDVMKAVFALVISWIVLVPEIVTTAQTVPAQAGRMSVSYVPPKNPAHQPIYQQLKEIRFLEKVQEFLSRV